MRVVKFFVYLCFLLLGRGEHFTARAFHHGDSYALTRKVEQQLLVSFMEDDEKTAFVKDTHPINIHEYLIGDEVEDEDPNSVFSPKYKLLGRANPAYSSLSDQYYHLRYCKNLSTISEKSSCKYLVQGVLRI